MHVTYTHSILFSFIFFRVIQLTVVASLNSADVFHVRLGVTVGNSVSNHVQTLPNSALGEVRAPFDIEVGATSYYERTDSGIACLTSLRLDV